MSVQPLSEREVRVLLAAHRDEYLVTCEEYVGMTPSEAGDALMDFEREVLAENAAARAALGVVGEETDDE